MIEYPKRLYRGGKGYTVNSIEEEQEFLGGAPASVSVPVSSEVNEVVEENELTDDEKKAEALDYLVSKGYSKKAARSILKKEGLEVVLNHKAEGTDPQE